LIAADGAILDAIVKSHLSRLKYSQLKLIVFVPIWS